MDMAGTVRFRLDEILDARGIKAEDFAKSAGIHYRTVLDLRSNRTRGISNDTLAKICDTLNITPAEILEYTPEVA